MKLSALIFFLSASSGIALAQTLPQSTLDRQQVGQLQAQLANPSISSTDRLHVTEQISTLQYRINTRPAIQEMTPAVTPPSTSVNSRADLLVSANSSTGSQEQCVADRAAIEYLRAQQSDSALSVEERKYAAPRISEIEADLHRLHC